MGGVLLETLTLLTNEK
ncbi:hypothetical protein RDI58_027366 [Solanum bulbocastanum]|uniref:Uncharacterized protein n=1 Tax=Solanum bulbocastanum TaxID=147425 RepID=A0AAN8Y1R3_SOLBU